MRVNNCGRSLDFYFVAQCRRRGGNIVQNYIKHQMLYCTLHILVSVVVHLWQGAIIFRSTYVHNYIATTLNWPHSIAGISPPSLSRLTKEDMTLKVHWPETLSHCFRLAVNVNTSHFVFSTCYLFLRRYLKWFDYTRIHHLNGWTYNLSRMDFNEHANY